VVNTSRYGAAAVAAAAVTCGYWTTDAMAGDPLNSDDRPTGADASTGLGARDEFNLVPVAGGTTDIGIGGGYFIGLDRVRPGMTPYVWDIESAGFVTFAPGKGGGVIVPYQDLYVQLTVPRFIVPTLELEIRPEYSWETTLGYYGLGDTSSASLPAGATGKYFEYGRLHPELYLQLRWRFVDHFIGKTGVRYVQNWLQVPSYSKLEQDLTTGSSEVKDLLGSTATSGIALFDYGIQLDTRDNDVSTHRGTFDVFDVQVSPGGVPGLPYRYMEGTADVRFFVPIWMPKITLAGRVAGDVLYGAPPFYELARFEDTYAIGGLNGVRGVPAQRYYGKVKVLANVELRTELVSFHALGKPLIFGAVAFLDGGRVWADTTAQPQLDGRGVGLKYGVGGGLRLQSGSAFVLRADLAWSPDATPIGAYVAAGEMF
jgi:outer membrane protein assembly factor BamA